MPVEGVWVLVVLATVALYLLARLLRRLRRLRYVPKEFLLTAAERRFAQVLVRALPRGVDYHAKVRLWDVVDAPAGRRQREALGKIRAKHLDFVLVDAKTSRILAAVELDDRSHEGAEARERDAEKDAALASAGVPLLRIPVARRYDPQTLLDPIWDALTE